VSGTGDLSTITQPGENPARGLEDLQRIPLLAAWPGTGADDNITNIKTHHITSFVALQAEIPASFLEGYVSTRTSAKSHHTHQTDLTPTENSITTSHLAQNFLTAFLDSIANNPERWFLNDKNLPPLSLKPGTQIAGRRNPNSGLFAAFILGTWSSTYGAKRSLNTDLSALPADTPRLPVTEFPSNEDAISSVGPSDGQEDAAGAVFYYSFTEGFVRAIDKFTSWAGLPWGMLEGGYQEFIVERVPGKDDMVRLSYVPVECAALAGFSSDSRSSTTIGESLTGQSDDGEEGNKGYPKRLPGILYEAHVLYAQFLLWKTIRHLRRQK